MTKTDHKIVIANATELKPDSKYLIVLDRNSCTMASAHDLLQGLKALGIDNAVAFMIDGDPNKTLQIVEQQGNG